MKTTKYYLYKFTFNTLTILLLTILSFELLNFTAHAFEDASMTLSEEEINRYLRDVNASGSNRYNTQVAATCLKCNQSLDIYIPNQECVDWVKYCCLINIGSIDWSWQVIKSYLTINECGIRFKGTLEVKYLGNTRLISFDLPAIISFSETDAKLKLHIMNPVEDIIILGGGEPLNVGNLDLSPFYDVEWRLSGQFNTLQSQLISGSVKNVTVQLTDGFVIVGGLITLN